MDELQENMHQRSKSSSYSPPSKLSFLNKDLIEKMRSPSPTFQYIEEESKDEGPRGPQNG